MANFNGRLIKVKKHIESKRNCGEMSGFKRSRNHGKIGCGQRLAACERGREWERERGWDRERGERRVERKVEADGRETDMWEEREKIKYIIERREKNNKFFFFGLAFVFVPFQIWNDIVHSC